LVQKLLLSYFNRTENIFSRRFDRSSPAFITTEFRFLESVSKLSRTWHARLVDPLVSTHTAALSDARASLISWFVGNGDLNRREKLVSFRRRSGSRDDVVDSNQAATCGRRPPTVGPRAAAARNQTRVNVIQLRRGWHGDAIVDRRTCDHQVASSISGQGAAA